MSYVREYFKGILLDTGFVTVANGTRLKIGGKGEIEVPINGRLTTIPDVLYVPDISYNLLSIARLADRGIECLFTQEGVTLRRDKKTLAYAKRYRNTYVLGPKDEENPTTRSVVEESNIGDETLRL